MTRHFSAKRPGSSYIRPKETKDVNAFHAFGVPGTPHVLVMFQDTAQETQNFLKFSLHIRPGDEVWLVRPFTESSVGQNPVIDYKEPMIPTQCQSVLEANILPPMTVTNTSYVFFDFISKNIIFEAATPQDNVCAGPLCDSQYADKSCGCTKADPARHWALRIEFGCEEMEELSQGQLSICSGRLTSLLVHESVRLWPATDPKVDVFAIDNSVTALLYVFYF